MSIYKCLVNGSIDAPTRCRVAEELERLTKAHIDLGDQAIDVEFVEVTEGAWFTGGVPSAASMVLGSVPPGTTQEVRTGLMDEIASVFSQITGSDLMDVMVVAADARPGVN
jgi:phenylpyruvate tautomerase PptA (4-oxalocrotonate tautomerase family)